VGKEAYLTQRDEEPVAILCTMTLDALSVAGGEPRYPIGMWPILDPSSKEVLVDDRGRRSYSTSTSYGPSLGKHIVMGYLPRDHAQVGNKLVLEYFDEAGDGHYPMTVQIVGRGSLYDSENHRVRG
jgi:glycine cleavage system aminomethyltransferase T